MNTTTKGFLQKKTQTSLNKWQVKNSKVKSTWSSVNSLYIYHGPIQLASERSSGTTRELRALLIGISAAVVTAYKQLD